MTTPARPSSTRSTLLAAGLVLASAAYFAQPAGAATPTPPTPTISVLDVKIGKEKTTAAGPTTGAGSGQGSGQNGGGRNKGGGFGGGNSSTVSNTGTVRYDITLRNTSKVPAKQVVVEYHFYNRTAVTTNGHTNYTMQDLTSTDTKDIDPGQNVVITSIPIPFEDTETQSSGGGGRTMGTPTSSSTKTSVFGWKIIMTYNDKPLGKPKENPDNLEDLIQEYSP